MSHIDDINPCKGCLNRYIGCHGSCDKFAEWRAELEREKKLKRMNDARYDDFSPRLDRLKRRRWH